jgi:hypothetical protein
MLKKAGKAASGDVINPEEEFKNPFVLEFLGLKDEYSESDLEEAPHRRNRTGRFPHIVGKRAAYPKSNALIPSFRRVGKNKFC